VSPESIRTLALLTEIHLSVREALIAWPDEVEPEDATEAARIAALVRLGIPPAEACGLVLGERENDLGSILERGEAMGGRTGRSVRAHARALEEKRAAVRAHHAAIAGAKLSAHIVVAVPAVAFAAAVWRAGLTAEGTALSLLGALLLGAGAWWMARSKPQPPDDGPERLAVSLADALEGGTSRDRALSQLATDDRANQLAGPRAAVLQGALWPEALATSQVEGVRRLGRACVLSRRYGRPLVPVLRTLAAGGSERRAAAMERALRRAPVRVVVPLALCILPGALLVAVGPVLA
jgi:hypothetical protein